MRLLVRIGGMHLEADNGVVHDVTYASYSGGLTAYRLGLELPTACLPNGLHEDPERGWLPTPGSAESP